MKKIQFLILTLSTLFFAGCGVSNLSGDIQEKNSDEITTGYEADEDVSVYLQRAEEAKEELRKRLEEE